MRRKYLNWCTPFSGASQCNRLHRYLLYTSTCSPKSYVLWYFFQSMMFKKLEWFFLDQGATYVLSEVYVVKCPLMAELTLKLLNMQKWHLQFQLCHQVALLNFDSIFSQLWNIAKKSIIQIFSYVVYWKFSLKFGSMYSRYPSIGNKDMQRGLGNLLNQRVGRYLEFGFALSKWRGGIKSVAHRSSEIMRKLGIV